jgi:HAD superfamily hydrolase (TIGR01509 family)
VLPEAVIFDLDGTLVDSERDGHLVAFNQAFAEARLSFRWSAEEYGRLLEIAGGRQRLVHDLCRRGMGEAEAEPLAARLHARKTELFREMILAGELEPRPGARELVQELVAAGVRLAIATTGGAAWVLPLLERLFDRGSFEVVITSSEAPALKPDPLAYRVALSRLGLEGERALAVEDSRNCLLAARGAGLACVMVLNDYSRGHCVDGADLALDSFGFEGAPANVIADPHGVGPLSRLTAATLSAVASAAAGG